MRAISHFKPNHPDFILTEEESRVIKALERVAKIWPKSL